MNNRFLFTLLLAPACLLAAWASSVVDVVMDNNYRLRGELVSYGKQGIIIKHPAMRQNAVILPSEIRALYFTGASIPDLRARDKIFMATGHRDIIPCQIISVMRDKVSYRDMLGNEHSIPRSQVAGFRLNTLQEKGFWQEPLVFDNSWVYSGRQNNDYRTKQGIKLINALRPKIQGDKYQYRLSDNTRYPTWVPLYKNIGLDPTSFTFHINIMAMDREHNRFGLVFCFGGFQHTSFRSNSASGHNRLMLNIACGKCTLLRERVDSIVMLGEVTIPAPSLTEGVDIRLTASRHGGNEQVYELLVGDLPPKLMTDPSPPEQPLKGPAFGLQIEGSFPLTITKLALSSITLSAKSVTKNGNSATDLVLTKEEDAIPGSISGYDSRTGLLTLYTDKDYPGIPRELSIPAKYLDTVFFAEQSGEKQNRKDDSRASACHSILMKDGSRLHGNLLKIDARNMVMRHPQLGQVSLPMKNITRVEFLNSAQPSRSIP